MKELDPMNILKKDCVLFNLLILFYFILKNKFKNIYDI